MPRQCGRPPSGGPPLLLPSRRPVAFATVQNFKPADDVEQFFRDRGLPGLVVLATQFMQTLVNVAFGRLHRLNAVGVLARQRFRTSSKQRNKQVLAPQGRQEIRTLDRVVWQRT